VVLRAEFDYSPVVVVLAAQVSVVLNQDVHPHCRYYYWHYSRRYWDHQKLELELVAKNLEVLVGLDSDLNLGLSWVD